MEIENGGGCSCAADITAASAPVQPNHLQVQPHEETSQGQTHQNYEGSSPHGVEKPEIERPADSVPLPHNAPPVDVKLFVGRVPHTVQAPQLRKLFSEFGEVIECTVIGDKSSSKHRNSAFVKMSSLAFADAAIRALHGSCSLEPGSGPLTVKYASGEVERLGLPAAAGDGGVNQAKLFVGSIPRTAAEDEIRNFFSKYGTVEEVFVIRDSLSGAGRGCAFVKLQYKEEALHAIKNLSGKHTFDGCSRPVDVRFAESKPPRQQQLQLQNQREWSGIGSRSGGHAMLSASHVNAATAAAAHNSNPRQAGNWREYFTTDGRPYYHNEVTQVTTWARPQEFDALVIRGSSVGGGDRTGPPGANVFVFHIPYDWTHVELLQAFGGFGPVVSCHVALDRQSGRNRGFAFVSYESVHSAVAAVNAMNNCVINNKRLNVSIKKGEEEHAAQLMTQVGFPQKASNSVSRSSAVMHSNPHQTIGQPLQQPSAYALGGQQWAGYGQCPPYAAQNHRFSNYDWW